MGRAILKTRAETRDNKKERKEIKKMFYKKMIINNE